MPVIAIHWHFMEYIKKWKYIAKSIFSQLYSFMKQISFLFCVNTKWTQTTTKCKSWSNNRRFTKQLETNINYFQWENGKNIKYQTLYLSIYVIQIGR